MSDKTKIAFQGEKGAYSHLACLEVFPKAEAVGCATFEEAFQIAKDDAEYKIVIPIENSLAGRVADIHYLIPKYKLQIHAEHFQKVSHNLLGVKGAKIKVQKKNGKTRVLVYDFFVALKISYGCAFNFY